MRGVRSNLDPYRDFRLCGSANLPALTMPDILQFLLKEAVARLLGEHPGQCPLRRKQRMQ